MRLIDEDALLLTVEVPIVGNGEFYSGMDSEQERCAGLIKDAPTIDPVKHGRWINTSGKHDRVYCSSCAKNRSDIEMIIDRQGHFRFFRYCPDCGAKMCSDEESR